MAEAFLNRLNINGLQVESAGIEPGKLNPLIVRVMAEEGVDISRNRTKPVKEFIDKGIKFDYVITVCDDASAEKCPVFPGETVRLHWPFDDPSILRGSEEEKLIEARRIRDEIKRKIILWAEETL